MKMKDIEENLNRLIESVESKSIKEIDELKYENHQLREKCDRSAASMEELVKVIKQKDKLISDIIHNIYSQDTSLQLAVLKPYRSKAIVYKDGKRLDTTSTTSVDICIDECGHVDATIRNE